MAKKLSGQEQKASMKALMDYRGEAQRLMKDKMNGLKKKSMEKASDKSSMEEAYDEASDLLDKDDEDTSLEEFGEAITGDDSTENEDDLDQKIAELMAKKKKMESLR